jgi:hypothetical protein
MTISNNALQPEAITRRLASGEKLVWWDRPSATGLARHELNFSTLLGVFFIAFAIFWMTTAYRAPGFFFLFGLLFVGAGLWMVTSPLRAYWAASWTLFALTDKRALILKGSKATGYPLDHVAFVETESSGDGRGNVLFLNQSASPLPWGANTGQMMRKGGFIAIADSERVGQEMLRLMELRRTSATSAHDD